MGDLGGFNLIAFESGGEPPHSKSFARVVGATNIAAASWSAPAPWRFGTRYDVVSIETATALRERRRAAALQDAGADLSRLRTSLLEKMINSPDNKRCRRIGES